MQMENNCNLSCMASAAPREQTGAAEPTGLCTVFEKEGGYSDLFSTNFAVLAETHFAFLINRYHLRF